MRDTRLKAKMCPICGKLLDAATSLDGDYTPSEGDLVICISCAGILIYEKDMTPVKCPPEVSKNFSDKTKEHILKATLAILFAKPPTG